MLQQSHPMHPAARRPARFRRVTCCSELCLWGLHQAADATSRVRVKRRGYMLCALPTCTLQVNCSNRRPQHSARRCRTRQGRLRTQPCPSARVAHTHVRPAQLRSKLAGQQACTAAACGRPSLLAAAAAAATRAAVACKAVQQEHTANGRGMQAGTSSAQTGEAEARASAALGGKLVQLHRQRAPLELAPVQLLRAGGRPDEAGPSNMALARTGIRIAWVRQAASVTPHALASSISEGCAATRAACASACLPHPT